MWNPFKKKNHTEPADLSLYNNSGELSTSVEDNNSSESNNYAVLQSSLIPAVDAEVALPVSADTPNVPDTNANDTLIPTNPNMRIAEMGVGLAHQAMDVYKTSMMVEQNIAAIRAPSEVQLAQIVSKFEFCKSALDHVFQDRHSALAAHYSVLNDAMKSNDRELIIGALRGISSIVVTSPLSDFTQIINNWDNFSKEKPLELDF